MNFDFVSMLYSLPAIIIGLTVHEYAHAWTADRLGDPTARNLGRLSLNPIRHIDPLGFLFLLVAGFGWAKPVSFDRANLRNPKRDEAFIAAAGPLANLVLALLFSLLLKLLIVAAPGLLSGASGEWGLRLLLSLVYLNYGLFIFNLIPLPPLDGSHILFGAIPIRPETEAKLYRYGSLALLGIILVDSIAKVDILPIGRMVRSLSGWVFSLLGIS
jgi:Zn-dependent protease